MTATARKLFVLGVWGHSDSGKTRLVEQLIPALRAHCVRVGTIKHASHGLTLDVEGKDSYRHGAAGAERVLLLGPGSATLFVHEHVEPELEGWLHSFEGSVDVLLVEGFKRTKIPHVQITCDDEADAFTLAFSADESELGWSLRRPPTIGDELHFPDVLVRRLASEILTRAAAR